jgi:hypothetical protein
MPVILPHKKSNYDQRRRGCHRTVTARTTVEISARIKIARALIAREAGKRREIPAVHIERTAAWAGCIVAVIDQRSTQMPGDRQYQCQESQSTGENAEHDLIAVGNVGVIAVFSHIGSLPRPAAKANKFVVAFASRYGAYRCQGDQWK